jgi:lipopolysaccharide transport system ATP-binding protein
MSDDFAVRVEGLGKKYRLRHQARQGDTKYTALRDVIAQSITAPFRALRRRGSNGSVGPDAASATMEEFWALRDVSFEIMPGESVGIIGRNGAGKSTLLKILSRITEPTTGRIEIEGRVSSLLEVGTGFHQELTGRENIYLNGTILGMKRSEIRKKFDEIVAFAEVDKFLDTPVKHFSSGMYVRLAFAIAAHLESEILIVDEVLAVGDAQFQKKCLGKMEDITGKGGRTLLFVSHNMDLVGKLCSKALLLTGGRASSLDPVDKVTSEYLNQSTSAFGTFLADKPGRSLRSVSIDPKALAHERIVLTIGYHLFQKARDLAFGIVIYTEGGSPITGSNTIYHPMASMPDNLSKGQIEVTFASVPFWSGRYTISVWITNGPIVIDFEDSALTFEFISSFTPTNAPATKYIGPVYLTANWQLV